MEFTEMQAQEAARSAGIDLEKERFDLKALTAGMNAELEHGTASPDTNITNDDPVMTAKLAAAHLRVSPFYYASGRGLKAWEASLRRGVKVKSSKTEHKTLSFRTEEYDEESGIFSGYAAVYGNIDSGGDIIEPGAFTKTIAEGWERVKILALHNDCWLPIGRPLELREDSNGLFIKAKISDTSMGGDDHRLQAGHRRRRFPGRLFGGGHRRSQGWSENQRDPAKGPQGRERVHESRYQGP